MKHKSLGDPLTLSIHETFLFELLHSDVGESCKMNQSV